MCDGQLTIFTKNFRLSVKAAVYFRLKCHIFLRNKQPLVVCPFHWINRSQTFSAVHTKPRYVDSRESVDDYRRLPVPRVKIRLDPV